MSLLVIHCFNSEQNYNFKNRFSLSQPISAWEQAGLRFIKPRLASFTAILSTSKHFDLNTLHCADYQYFQYFDLVSGAIYFICNIFC